jgi:molecular chaperone DnaJ
MHPGAQAAQRYGHQRVGVPPDADTAAIKKAYRAKAKVMHPDKIREKPLLQAWRAGDDAHRFSRLVEAYECLTDDERRANYDAGMRGEL